MSHISRNGVQFNKAQSAELYLPVVQSWPANFCSFWEVIDAVKAAVAAHGQYDISSYQHVLIFVPKHCGNCSL
jgi:hypothetical protein